MSSNSEWDGETCSNFKEEENAVQLLGWVLRWFMIGWLMEDQIKFSRNHKGLECYTGGLLTVSQLQGLMWLYMVS